MIDNLWWERNPIRGPSGDGMGTINPDTFHGRTCLCFPLSFEESCPALSLTYTLPPP